MSPANWDANINTVWASLLIAELIKNGLDTFFISPGNRNAPLLAALAANPRSIKKSVIDERAAAFCALGHARATGRAGVLVCTSGTAPANYYPAVIEAARDCLPLVVLSADRPSERVTSDANQSIEQTGLFGRFVVHTLNLPGPSETGSLEALLADVDYLISRTREPVHINLPLDNPLVPAPGPLSQALRATARQHLARPAPLTVYHATQTIPADLAAVAHTLASARRGLLVIGRLEPTDDRNTCLELVRQLNWPVFCDIASSLKWRLEADAQILPVDHPAALALVRQYAPDVILQLGSGLVSKAYYTQLLPQSSAHLIQVSSRPGRRDPAHRVNLRIATHVQPFIAHLPDLMLRHSESSAKAHLLKSMQALGQALAQATPSDVLSFPLIAQYLHRAIPDGEALFLGNSLSIRVFDACRPEVRKQVEMVTQRGVSGIEGHLATSIGYAEAARKRTTALMGDIALLHDLNSLLLLSRSRVPVILVVVNNQGGRIFERLPAADFSDLLHPWMTTPHELDIGAIARPFGLAVWTCTTPAELRKNYDKALALQMSCVLEIKLSAETDMAVYRQRQAAHG